MPFSVVTLSNVWNCVKSSPESGKEAAYVLQMMRTEKLLKRAIEHYADGVCEPKVIEETTTGIFGQLSKWGNDMRNVILDGADGDFSVTKLFSLTFPVIAYISNQIAMNVIAIFQYSVDCIIVCVKNSLQEMKFLKFVV